MNYTSIFKKMVKNLENKKIVKPQFIHAVGIMTSTVVICE